MAIVPQDAYSGSEELNSKNLENQELDDSTHEPGLQLEKIGDFDQAEKIETVLRELVDQTVDAGLAGGFSPDEVLRQAQESFPRDSSLNEENAAEGTFVILPLDFSEMG